MDGNGRPRPAGGEPRGEKRLSCSPEHVIDLVRRAQGGEIAAEHALHELFKPKLLAVLSRYRGDAIVAEDLEGMGYLLLHDCDMRFDETRGVSFFTFLDRTLAQNAWSYVRGERRDAQRSQASGRCAAWDDEGDASGRAGPEEACAVRIKERGWLEQVSGVEEAVIIRHTLQAAVETLPARQRRAYALWAAGDTVKEIAAALGIEQKNCYRIIQGLRATLRDTLEKIL